MKMRHYLPLTTLLLLHSLVPALAPAQPRAQDEVLRVIAMPTVREVQNAGKGILGVPIDKDFKFEFDRLVGQAQEEGVTTLVLEITTPGGAVDVSLMTLATLKALRESGVRTIAYAPSNAISAGALIAFGCDELLLGPQAEIGNIIPLSPNGRGNYVEADRKHVTHLIGEISKLATRSGYDPVLLRSMVDPEMEVYYTWYPDSETPPLVAQEPPTDEQKRQGALRTRKIIGKSSALVVTAGSDFTTWPNFQKVFPYRTCMSRHDLPELLGLGSRKLASEELLQMPIPSGFGYFSHLLKGIDWSIILLVLGIILMVSEFFTPGVGIFAIGGILCFVGYFALNSSEGLPLAFSVGLLILGFLLVLVEVLIIPGFGVAGISGILLIVFSVYSATVGLPGESFTDRLVPDSAADWVQVQAWLTTFLGVLVIGTVAAFLMSKSMHHFPLLGRLFQRPPVAAGASGTLNLPLGVGSSGRIKVMVGEEGLAASVLRPGGKAKFKDEIVDVVSSGAWIDKGTPIVVIHIEGVRVVVESRNPGDLA